jgi:hypothetical protein
MIATFEEVKQMIETPAELDPRLKLYLSQYGDDTVLKHPLVNECPYDSDLNNLYNKRLASANKALGKAEKSEDWYSYIHIHEKPWRLEVFEKIKGKLSNEEYWVILSSILSNCFNLWQYKSKLPRLLRSRDCGRKGIMTNEEQDRYDALPEEITVHRGYRRHFNKSGWTWTSSSLIHQTFDLKRQGV